MHMVRSPVSFLQSKTDYGTNDGLRFQDQLILGIDLQVGGGGGGCRWHTQFLIGTTLGTVKLLHIIF